MSGSEGSDHEAQRSSSGGGEEDGTPAGIPAPGSQEARADGGQDGASAVDTSEGDRPAIGPKLYSSGSWDRDVANDDALDPVRKPPWRDYSRIIHSASFRRLQGKTQVFPVHESDFFRNRLTHSLEVAQIAEGIAQRLNATPSFEADPINERACMNAALIHDLGHPPFGHNGERALDDAMRAYGGFEGNAQTIRIIARLEKKFLRQPASSDDVDYCDEDSRAGLGLTYRTILSALKYDRVIPHTRGEQEKLVKGYYATEKNIIDRAKFAVDPEWTDRHSFKTIECSIMDIADDIAYSTYDLEDCLKAGFLSPAEILATDQGLFDRVAEEANKSLKNKIDGQAAVRIFSEVFSQVFDSFKSSAEFSIETFVDVYRLSRSMSEDGYVRTALSSTLVHDAISWVKVDYNEDAPWLSKAYLPEERLAIVEVLKHFTYLKTIHSARVKVGEYRGYEVITKIFEALAEAKGNLLMPEDLKASHKTFEHNASARNRAICDFIAGMTDRYALEFYARLHSDDPQSIFKPI
ncbi:dGTP triphosphohydrolase [Methylobacterium sp. CM6246]